jgi:hypothetical protein
MYGWKISTNERTLDAAKAKNGTSRRVMERDPVLTTVLANKVDGTFVPLIEHSTMEINEVRGGAVVEALRYKPEGHGIDSRWCHWNFSLT